MALEADAPLNQQTKPNQTKPNQTYITCSKRQDSRLCTGFIWVVGFYVYDNELLGLF
jgi:hypothetical protein